MKGIILALVGLFAGAPSLGLALSCNDLDGAEVWSHEPTPVYLGFFGSQFAAESIENPYGTYGSQFSTLSVHDTFGNYGSQFSTYSANNPFTTTPPGIFKAAAMRADCAGNDFQWRPIMLVAINVPYRAARHGAGSDRSPVSATATTAPLPARNARVSSHM